MIKANQPALNLLTTLFKDRPDHFIVVSWCVYIAQSSHWQTQVGGCLVGSEQNIKQLLLQKEKERQKMLEVKWVYLWLSRATKTRKSQMSK